jgi:hypothetical protein
MAQVERASGQDILLRDAGGEAHDLVLHRSPV